MNYESDQSNDEPKMWLIIGAVFLSLVLVLGIVYKREKEKPHSPHALVAAGFSQLLNIKEWKPGMGTKPLVYHPAAATAPVWRPLPGRNISLAAGG